MDIEGDCGSGSDNVEGDCGSGSANVEGDSGSGSDKPTVPLGLQHHRGRTPKAIATIGALSLFFIVGSQTGPLATRLVYHGNPQQFNDWFDMHGSGKIIVAVGIGRWHLLGKTDPVPPHANKLKKLWRCSSDIVGWVSYVLEDFIVPDIGFVNYNNERPEQLWNKFCNIDFIHPFEPGGAKVLCEWIQDWKQKFEVSVLEMCVCCFGVAVVLNICDRLSPMYMVPIRAQRGPRRSDLIGGKPAKSAIHRFRVHLKCARASVDDRPQQLALPMTSSFGGWPAHILFKWVKATLYTKTLRKMGRAKRAFAEIMDLDEIALERVRNSKDVGYEQLRKARTKWDICWNLAFRRFFAQPSYSQSWLNLFVDCSPQKRGQKLFSASLEVIVDSIETYFLRRMFPQTSIGVSCTTLLGKVATLLWAIYLLVCLNYYAFLSFLGCVTWILTDYGTENGGPRFSRYLWCVFVAFGVHVPADAVQLDFLFPHAMLAPGWEHSIDGLLRYFLCLFPWFPTILRDLKKNLAILINRYGPNLADTLDMAGLRGAAAVIRKQSVATFVHWRLGTTLEVCKDCCINFPILKLNLESIRAYLHTQYATLSS